MSEILIKWDFECSIYLYLYSVVLVLILNLGVERFLLSQLSIGRKLHEEDTRDCDFTAV